MGGAGGAEARLFAATAQGTENVLPSRVGAVPRCSEPQPSDQRLLCIDVASACGRHVPITSSAERARARLAQHALGRAARTELKMYSLRRNSRSRPSYGPTS